MAEIESLEEECLDLTDPVHRALLIGVYACAAILALCVVIAGFLDHFDLVAFTGGAITLPVSIGLALRARRARTR